MQKTERQYEELIGYVDIMDLIRNGGDDCTLHHKDPHTASVEVYTNDHAYAYRGANYVVYDDTIISLELKRSYAGANDEWERNGPTVGLLSDASEVMELIYKKTGIM